MPRAIFMGSDDFSLPILKALLDRGPALSSPAKVAAVVTQPDRPVGRGRRLSENPVKTLALERAVPVLQPERLRDPEAIAAILGFEPDVLIVASFGQILPKQLLDRPPHHAVNLHPSLLPLYRGPSPVAGAILEGAVTTGVTLMLMSPKMDAGPILDQVDVRIDPEATAGELRDELALVSADLLLQDLPAWIAGRLQERPQDESRATYTGMIHKADGEVDWSEPASLLARKVRAYNPWPTAFTWWQGKQVRLLRARPVEGAGEPGQVQGLEGDVLLVGTGDCMLGVQELQLAGGKPLKAREVIRGHPALQTAHLGQEIAWSSP